MSKQKKQKINSHTISVYFYFYPFNYRFSNKKYVCFVSNKVSHFNLPNSNQKSETENFKFYFPE